MVVSATAMSQVNVLEEEWEFLTELLPKDWREQARSSGALRRGEPACVTDERGSSALSDPHHAG